MAGPKNPYSPPKEAGEKKQPEQRRPPPFLLGTAAIAFGVVPAIHFVTWPVSSPFDWWMPFVRYFVGSAAVMFALAGIAIIIADLTRFRK